jgi:WD40 repeat protein
LIDAQRFVAAFGSIMELAPLQIYGSALAFAPTNSVVKLKFWDERLSYIDNAFGIPENWEAGLQVLESHSGGIRAIAFRPDGKVFASASEDLTVRLWSTTAVSARLVLQHQAPVSAIAFSADGMLLASSSIDGTVWLWDTATGAVRIKFKSNLKPANMITFLQNGHVVSSSSDGAAQIWEITGESHLALKGNSIRCKSIAVSSDDRLLALPSGHTVQLWDIASKAIFVTLKDHSSWVIGVVFSPDGKFLASISSRYIIWLWDTTTGELLWTFQGHSDYVDDIAFSPDGNLLALVYDRMGISIWNTVTGEKMFSLDDERENEIHDNSVLAFSPDGRLLASTFKHSCIRFWDVSTGVAHSTLDCHTSPESLTFSPDGKLLVSTAAIDNVIRTWDPTFKGERGQSQRDDLSRSLSMRLSRDSKLLASIHVDWGTSIWNATTGAVLAVQIPALIEGDVVDFSPDNKLLALAWRNSIQLWDISNMETNPKELIGNSYGINDLAFSPDGKLLASASEDTSVEVWNVTANELPPVTLLGHSECVNAVTFSPDGKLLASASNDFTVQIWDSHNWKSPPITLNGHSKLISWIAFSPNSKLLASTSFDNTVRLWDVVAGKELSVLEVGRVYGELSFSSSGSYINLPGKCINVTPSHSMSFSPFSEHFIYYNHHDTDKWIKDGDNCLLWLPPDFRSTNSVINEGVIALGVDSGDIIIIRVNLSNIGKD